MNAASQWRHALAQHLAPIYAANPHVAAVLLGGSTARVHADRYSDIELGVFWHQPPTDSTRQMAAAHISADLIALYPYDPAEEVWCDDFMLGRAHPDQPKSGVLVEVLHYTTDYLHRAFDAVIEQHTPDALKQNLIAGVVDGVPLYNADLVQHWKARATPYPDGLAIAVVNRYAQIDHFWRWEMWLERNANLMMLYQSFAQVQHNLLHMLLGLNHVYYFGFKWLDVVAERLPYKPDDLVQRFARVYQVEPAIGAQELSTLMGTRVQGTRGIVTSIGVITLEGNSKGQCRRLRDQTLVATVMVGYEGHQGEPMSTQAIYNYRKVNDQLITGGQPTEEQLTSAADEGFRTVINLATINPRYSLEDEAGFVRSLGMTYHHIPVDWENPEESDFAAFEAVMKALPEGKTLIHCAANFRVTAFYSLYALKHLGWSTAQADAFRDSIWQGSDHPIWETFIAERKAGITSSRSR